MSERVSERGSEGAGGSREGRGRRPTERQGETGRGQGTVRGGQDRAFKSMALRSFYM